MELSGDTVTAGQTKAEIGGEAEERKEGNGRGKKGKGNEIRNCSLAAFFLRKKIVTNEDIFIGSVLCLLKIMKQENLS